MSKVSNIISSYVVSIYNGQIEGIVNNILFNNKKNAKYLVISQNDEQFLILDTKNIYKIGEGAVLIKNNSALDLMESTELKVKNCFSPINSIVVSTDGNLLGHVTDIELDSNYSINKFLVDGQTIDLENVVNISESAIIVSINGKKPNLVKFKGSSKIKININNIDEKVTTMQNQTILPNRTITNYTFLIGRKVSQNISNFNGEIIIKENQIINSKIVDIARINGKIRELTKNSI